MNALPARARGIRLPAARALTTRPHRTPGRLLDHHRARVDSGLRRAEASLAPCQRAWDSSPRKFGALAPALKAHRNLRERVVTQDDGSELTNKVVRMWLERAQRAASLEQCGGIHRLRHMFCSHLAMRGATVMAIKALAGHASISTTQRTCTSLRRLWTLRSGSWTRPATHPKLEAPWRRWPLRKKRPRNWWRRRESK